MRRLFSASSVLGSRSGFGGCGCCGLSSVCLGVVLRISFCACFAGFVFPGHLRVWLWVGCSSAPVAVSLGFGYRSGVAWSGYRSGSGFLASFAFGGFVVVIVSFSVLRLGFGGCILVGFIALTNTFFIASCTTFLTKIPN